MSIWVPWGHISGRWYGNRKERPILAIHGYLDNLGTFDRLIPLLPDYLGGLCIDLPSRGYSSPLPPGNDFFDSVFIIGWIMKEFKWSKVSLIGHSFGGVLGFMYTSLAPHIVESLCNFVSNNTFQSVPKQYAHHLLKQSICKSQLYPDKFYISKDNRVKYFNELLFSSELGPAMARRIGKKPVLIIKGSESPFISEKCNELIFILEHENPYFEFHEVSGLQHVHLTNATECARHIIPFLKRHRPPCEGMEFLRMPHKL